MSRRRDRGRYNHYLPKKKSPIAAVLGYSGLLFLVGYVLYLGHQATDLFVFLTESAKEDPSGEVMEPEDEAPSTTFQLELPPEVKQRDQGQAVSDGDGEQTLMEEPEEAEEVE